MPHALGLVKDTHDRRDQPFSLVANHLGLLDLPRSVDLRPLCSPVRDQLNLGSCSGEATVGFLECLLLQRRMFTALSPLFVYYWERSLERTIKQDAGAMIRDGMRVLRKLGAPPEFDWPYDIPKFKDRPPQQAMDDAADYRIASFHRCNNLIEIKQALTINQPVVIGIEIFESFESDDVARTGMVPIPNQDVEKYLGGHAVVCVGYQDSHFIVRNSWGSDFGQKGYFMLPFSFFRPNLALVSDCWTGSV